ncbi:MAG TPA: class I SAM-dependent methyltransferase [Treponemataceae bacterium]|nr:class I SAM-dependent methyltransferase [Treponemataceae bacterium]
MTKTYSVGKMIYDPKIYDGLNTQKEDIAFYKKWISENHIRSVLELCCGTGRITIPLAKEGINISGLDYSNAMLSEAKEKAQKENLTIPFTQGDMRNFKLDKKFEMIFIPFNSIHCLYEHSDFIDTMNSIYKHLEDSGFLIIDYFNPSLEYIVENSKKPLVIAEYETEDGRYVKIIQTMEYDDHTQVNRVKWEHSINGEFSSKESLDMRMFYPQELDYLITSSRFKIVNKFGSYERSDFSKGSQIQLVICQKC